MYLLGDPLLVARSDPTREIVSGKRRKGNGPADRCVCVYVYNVYLKLLKLFPCVSFFSFLSFSPLLFIANYRRSRCPRCHRRSLFSLLFFFFPFGFLFAHLARQTSARTEKETSVRSTEMKRRGRGSSGINASVRPPPRPARKAGAPRGASTSAISIYRRRNSVPVRVC